MPVASELERRDVRMQVRALLAADAQARLDAARQLDPDGRFAEGAAALAVLPGDDAGVTRAAIDAQIARIRDRLPSIGALCLARPRHALLVVPAPSARAAHATAGRVRAVAAASPEPGPTVAAGGVVPRLGDIARSYRQALRAAHVAAVVPDVGGAVVSWDDLGVYRMLTAMPVDRLGADVLHPGLRALLGRRRTHELLPTLERYLDLGGDVQRAAASLHLHRTTLYHRLRRIERLADIDLRKGDDRLAMHLSMKIARLQGMTWS